MNSSETSNTNAIAIIALNGRFPGAKNIDEFWQNLCDGVETISHFTDAEMLAAGIDAQHVEDPHYVKAKGIVKDIELFDAPFFHFNPREAQVIDPQQRLFLECCWEVLEKAGYSSDTYEGKVGVFAGTSISTYLLNNLSANMGILEAIGMHQVMIGNDKDFLTSLVAYKLNLKGPAVTVQTACSTSLVAAHLACQSLLSYQCDIALAGGVTIQVPQQAGYMYTEGGIASPDGHCRAFDAQAQGTVGGNGVGVVVLKRLEDALADRDQIYAVIKGSAINNDGADKVGFTAPSITGQSEVIAEALALAEVEPETLGYIEAHGTGTLLGDPIELAALTRAFRLETTANQFCALGSVKTNIGHLDAASGIAGLIKAALILQHKRIPPSLNFKHPNPALDLAHSPFYVNNSIIDWPEGSWPHRAGVSSFGIGGTNVHMVLEEAPAPQSTGPARPWQLLTLSAKSDTALEQATDNIADYLKNASTPLPDIAYTLNRGRKQFSHRRIIVCQETGEAANILAAREPERIFTAFQEARQRSVAFLFPGGGAQYVNMAHDLYQSESGFRITIDTAARYLSPQLHLDIRDILYPCLEKQEEANRHLLTATIGLPVLFSIEYALAKLWQEWGIQPRAMLGHSLGEYTAACLAGVFSFEDALSLVVVRGQLFDQLPAGAMLSVPLSEADIHALQEPGLSIAAVNGPALCTVSGSVEVVAAVEQTLQLRGIETKRIHINVAAHSTMVEPILKPFQDFVNTIALQKPTIPFVSNVTGTWITAEEATDPTYWVRHLQHTVRFADGLQLLLQETDQVLLEVGPGKTLSSLAYQQARGHQIAVLQSLPHLYDPQPDMAFLLTTLGRLWIEGVAIMWDAFYANERRQRLVLPTYPFERQTYWLEPRPDNLPASALLARSQTDQDITQSHPADTLQEQVSDQKVPSPYLSTQHPYVAPNNQVEEQIVAMWQQLLGIKTIGIHDNFFELGGHSLLGTQLATRLRDIFHISFPLRTLFERQTVAALALAVMEAQAEQEQQEDIEQLLASLEDSAEEDVLGLPKSETVANSQ